MSSLRARSLKDILTFTRSTTATYFDIDGTLQTAAIDEPRIEYDPATGAVRGLLIEEARTNLLLNSDTLATQSVTVTAVPHTLSFYGTGTVTLSGASTAGPLVGTGASDRVSLTFTPSAASLTLTLSGSATRAQLEAGPYATSYIPTTSAAVTRAADVCITSVLNPWFNEDEGTFFCEFWIPWTYIAADTAARRLIQADDNGGDAHIAAYLGGGNIIAEMYDDGASVASFNSGAFAPNTALRQAYAWNENGAAVAATGGYFGTDSSVTLPSGVAILRLGSHSAAGSEPNGYIRKVKFYPRRLSDNELRALVA